MENQTETLATLQKRWDSACRIIFGREIGPLPEYRGWLLENTEPVMRTKSSLSGKEITYAIEHYAPKSKWISFDEIEFGKKFKEPKPDAKNMEELLASLSDRLHYAGNIVIGECGHVEKSSNMDRCFFTHETTKMVESKYMAYTTVGRLSEDCYGCNGLGNTSVALKCYETFFYKRCLELWMSQHCSDCHYSYGLINCSDCLFCFHLRGRKNCIANVQLAPQEYKRLKEKLMGQMADYLTKNRRLPSLAELASGWKLDRSLLEKIKPAPGLAPKTSMEEIEKAFSKTCELVLGKKLDGRLDDYAGWLKRHKRKIGTFRSAISKKEVHMGDYCALFTLPKERLICADETKAFGENICLEEKEARELSFPNALEPLGKIAYFSPEYYEGTTENIIACPTALDSAHAYHAFAVVWAKYCAFGFWPRSSEYVFGMDTCLSSAFVINGYQSVGLKRCMEMDNCLNCSDCYFCHNAENCTECILCFDAKNLKYAIGNVEIGREKYMEIKDRLLHWMREELQKTKSLKLDIYNVGAQK